MNPDDVDGRRFLTWLEAQMREGGWIPTFQIIPPLQSAFKIHALVDTNEPAGPARTDGW